MAGLINALASGVSAGAGAAANYYGKAAIAEELSRLEEEKAARLADRGSAIRMSEEQTTYDRKVSRAPGENQMAVERQGAIAKGLLNTRQETAEQSRALDAADAAAKDKVARDLTVGQAGDKDRMAAERKIKMNTDIDRGAGLRAIQVEAAQLQLDRAKLENKIPPAEAKMFDAIKKQIEINETAIAKVQAEGGAPPPEMTKKVSDLVGEQKKLLAPYLKEGAKTEKPPAIDYSAFDKGKRVVQNATADVGGAPESRQGLIASARSAFGEEGTVRVAATESRDRALLPQIKAKLGKGFQLTTEESEIADRLKLR